MATGGPGARRLRFDCPEVQELPDPAFPGKKTPPAPETLPSGLTGDDDVSAAVCRTRDYLLSRQHADGYWVGELEGDTILESEYVLLLAYLGREDSEEAKLCANYLLEQQLASGGWALYPGGPLEISASVKAYFALKLTGHTPDIAPMRRAREAILAAGGAERVNSFTRFYLALLGTIGYRQCPAVPPELMLIPRWMPFNIYEMSAWSRTILVPLSIMWAEQPVREIPPERQIPELFCNSPQELPVTMPAAETRDPLARRRWIDWHRVFNGIDRVVKWLNRWRIRPFRRLALRKAAAWVIERFDNSDGLGAIFPPIIWSVVALRCLGYDDDSPEVRSQLHELEKLFIREDDTLRLQPCKSPVWDTAISTIALREAGVSADHPALRQSVSWLLSKEVRTKGDWATRHPGHEAGGWFFEFNNAFYPDVDDTSMVVMALRRCLPETDTLGWDADFLLGEWSPHEADADAAAVLAGRTRNPEDLPARLESAAPHINAIWRGARWVLAMQNSDGGWGAFDRNNDRELYTQVPFADHNAMIDPSSVDLTSRNLEMLAALNVGSDFPAVQEALQYIWTHQEPEHCWYGRWGVNYIYGTWQTLVGLTAIGIPTSDPRIRRAADWLKSVQQENGGWGESCGSYDDPQQKGRGPVTASQTAWALMGLMAAGESDSEPVRRGVQYLLEAQKPDGTWDEPYFTGTGFPKVFYLKYHLYCIYFPLMALGRYVRQRTRHV